MKKVFNVQGTKFTVNVDVDTQDHYDTITEDHKKVLYLLGQVSNIGSKLDFEFTTRNRNLEYYGEEWEFNQSEHKKLGMEKLVLTSKQKDQILDTIDSTMWWYKALKSEVERL